MLHLIKLCVGCESVQQLKSFQQMRGRTPYHVTRMFPKRAEEIVGQGSLYWVINGFIEVRQIITSIERVVGEDDISRCKISLDPKLIRVASTRKRPFQGWRYFNAEDAPIDIGVFEEDGLPDSLTKELSMLGLR